MQCRRGGGKAAAPKVQRRRRWPVAITFVAAAPMLILPVLVNSTTPDVLVWAITSAQASVGCYVAGRGGRPNLNDESAHHLIVFS